MNNSQKHQMKSAALGMTFIEVLVALVILVTGILGAVAMQASAKKGSFDAMQRSAASALAQDIIERMRSNDPTTLANYVKSDYGVTLDSGEINRCNTRAVRCTADEMRINDQYEWELSLMGADVTNGANNAGGLIGARACIKHALNAVTVVISWEGRTAISDAEKDSCGAAGDKRRQVVVEAFVN